MEMVEGEGDKCYRWLGYGLRRLGVLACRVQGFGVDV
jgi:hypothetical protein